MCYQGPEPQKDESQAIDPWYHWKGKEENSWYYGGWITNGRKFGNLWFHVGAAVTYFGLAVLTPLVLVGCAGSIKGGIEKMFACPVVGLLWLAIVALGLPAFIWLERLSFDDWVNQKNKDPKQKKRIIARFELNTKHMEVFWKTVAGLYLTGGLLSFANVGQKKQTEPATKEEIVALTTAIKDLAKATAAKANQLPASPAGENLEK